MTFKITTLGCKVNQYESEKIKEALVLRGFSEVDEDKPCDLHIINTCTVTHIADRKSRQKIRQAVKLSPNGKIIATGCGVGNDSSDINKISDDIIIVKNKDKNKFADIIENLFSIKEYNHAQNTFVRSDRTRAYLKTGDGCEHFCTYCIVPYVRGKIVSRPSEDIMKEASEIINSGCKEIVLTAIHLGTYGHGLDEKINLAILLDRLATKFPETRFRISSIEPMDFSEDMISVMKNHSGICRHIHLPLQHASDRVLERMNRDYSKDDFRKIIEKIRNIIPEISLTADVIVGFPGETDEDFAELCDFVKEINFYRCHVFKYSKREGTPASKFKDQVPEIVKANRSAELIKISSDLEFERNKSFIGKNVTILTEYKNESEFWNGLTSEYIRAEFKGNDDIKENMFVDLKITEATPEGVKGVLLTK